MADVDPWDEAFDETEVLAQGAPETPAATGEEIPLGADEAPAGDTEGAGEPATAETPPETPPEEPDYRKLIEQLEHRVKSAEGRAVAFQQRLEQLQTPAPKAPEQPAAADPEEEFLAKFRAKYDDDVLKAIELVADRKAKSMVKASVSPVTEDVQKLISQMHVSAIEAVHPDMAQIAGSEELGAWIDSQPLHRQRAYRSVVDGGSAREVIDLLTEYKEARKPPPAPAKAAPAAAPASRSVQAAVAVPAARGGLVRPETPPATDFDSAWEEATRAG